MQRTTRLINTLALLMLGCLLAAPAAAADRPLGPDWRPIDTARLDAMRGGFVVPTGFVISFGIERVVSINGDIVASTQLRIPDIARVTADEARLLATLRDSQVVSVGAGTVVSAGTGGLVIQNTLDGQAISARTSLDVSLNTLQLHRENLFSTAITSAVIGGIPSL
jgi:hypothetical protein